MPLRYMGVERTPIKSLHTKLTLEKKILPPLQPGFKLATFRSRVRYSINTGYPGLWIYVVLIDTVRHFKAVLVCLECSEFICSSFGSRYRTIDMLIILLLLLWSLLLLLSIVLSFLRFDICREQSAPDGRIKVNVITFFIRLYADILPPQNPVSTFLRTVISVKGLLILYKYSHHRAAHLFMFWSLSAGVTQQLPRSLVIASSFSIMVFFPVR